MKKIREFLFSSRLMAVILIIFALSIAVATFIENDFGSQTARAVVYNSWWFTTMLFIGLINLSGTIIIRKLYSKEKLTLFIFHMAFIVILAGAAITRFIGFEGNMHIRAGESSNQMVSAETYLQATVNINGESNYAEKHVYFSALSDNYYKLKLNAGKKDVAVECLKIIPNAQETVVDDPQGSPVLTLVMAGASGRQTVLLASGQTKMIGNLAFSFNDTTHADHVNIVSQEGNLTIKSPVMAMTMNMATQVRDSLHVQQYYPFNLLSLYSFGRVQLVAKALNPQGRIDVTSDKEAGRDENPDALFLKISSGDKSRPLTYFANHGALNDPIDVKLNDISVSVAFGAKVVQLPFSLQLNQFILNRYPGSNSPSGYESKVLLNDESRNVKEEHRIFMNNVLNYRGYRFFQSSYDNDEQGTILSVNHDYWGTMITYLGYLLLALGIVLSLLNRNSRFRKLSAELTRLRETRKAASFIVLLTIGLISANGQTSLPDSLVIDKVQAEKFGKLLVQDPGGRIKPVNTLSSELLRKISRKSDILGQSYDQVMLGMLTYPEFWQTVPMIRVSHPEIQKILHVYEPYVSFNGVLDRSSTRPVYLLEKYVNEAFQKKPVKRTTFDTEIIRLDERISLCYQIYSGDLLRLFPKRSDPAKTWISPTNLDSTFHGQDSMFTASILPLYLHSLRDARYNKNYKMADEAMRLMSEYQTKFGGSIVPSPSKVKLEIIYNRLNIFDRLSSIYGLIGFILLILQFETIFKPKINLKKPIIIATGVVILCFVVHMAGLISRWYISGHAPWSNAYESLIYIAFATILAGLVFSRKSSIALPVTALLAWLILFVAHLNWMDPEITNLVPVLKSYWLLIHVAVITGSYGFLALGALLAFLNLVLMIFRTKGNNAGNAIAEITIVIEMTLIVGLYMLTIGTFLGGVWANESWGRYWGWDPKETWALVSVLVYAFVSHMRMVPGLKGTYLFNLMSLVAFSSIIMTYFGVNYYLSGMHSYAKGDPLPIPTFVYYTIAIVAVVGFMAWWEDKKYRRSIT